MQPVPCPSLTSTTAMLETRPEFSVTSTPRLRLALLATWRWPHGGTARERTRRPSCFHVPRQNTEAQLKSTPRPALSHLLDSQESSRGRRGPETTAQPPTAQVLSGGRLRASGWLGDSGLKPGNHLRGLGYTARTAGQDARPQASLRSRETQGQGLAPRARGPATWSG